MSALNNSLLLGQEGGGGYAISRSLRFNSSDSAYLSRTPASAGNRKTWTWAGWVKNCLGPTSYNATLLFARNGTGTGVGEMFWVALNCVFTTGGYQVAAGDGATNYLVSSALFRDPSSWYHLVCAYDSTQASSDNRLKVYVNGTEITSWSANNRANITLNSDSVINRGSVQHEIGSRSAIYSDCYLADIHFIDGQALDPSSFGEFDANGIWQPKAYTGTYGTNGFHLDLADNSNNTATTLGKDTSGNGNNWTPNNLSVTAGAGNDSLVDSPTSTSGQTDSGAGGTVIGNYAVFNPLEAVTGASKTLSNGNLDVTIAGSAPYYPAARPTIPVSQPSGKYLLEITIGSKTGAYWQMGLNTSSMAYSSGDLHATFRSDANISNTLSGSWTGAGVSFTTGDVIGVAFDNSNNSCAFYKNGTYAATFTVSGSLPAGFNFGVFAGDGSGGNAVYTLNAGQRAFAYPISGYKALCTANLPTPTILKGSDYFDTKLYTGNGSTQTISGLAFSPDLVWTKGRSIAELHLMSDSVRGVPKNLYPNLTNAEDSTNYLSALTSDGFTVQNAPIVNNNGSTYAAWCWDAGTSNATNTAGSITSTVRANASAGFSIVTYTGTGANATVGHGGLANLSNGMIIVKNRSSATNWRVYHSALGNTKVIFLSTTGTPDTNSVYWNNTSPTSTVFSVGSDDGVNGNGNSMVAYCFAPVAGYSSMGSYTGDGSTSGFGPFIHCGFRPKFVLIKGSSVAYDWLMLDAVRNPYNLTTQVLYANSSIAEMTNNGTGSGGYESIDILSNGFQIKSNSARYNQSGATYIYFAVAESPFSIARAR